MCVRRKWKSEYGKIQRNFITESHALKVHFRAHQEEEIEAKIDEKRKRKKFMFLPLFLFIFKCTQHETALRDERTRLCAYRDIEEDFQ